jgi:hypothetical protein
MYFLPQVSIMCIHTRWTPLSPRWKRLSSNAESAMKCGFFRRSFFLFLHTDTFWSTGYTLSLHTSVIMKPSFPLQWKCCRDSVLHSSVRPDVIKWTVLLIRPKYWYQNENIYSLMRRGELKLSFPFQAFHFCRC